MVQKEVNSVSMLIRTTKVFLVLLNLQTFSAAQTWVQSGYWYAGSEYPVPDINSALFTHLNCAFANINSSSYELSISSTDEPYVSTFTEIVKRKNPSVATLLSVLGGGENEPSFFSMVSQSSRRRSFIVSSIKLARAYGFQGLDLFKVNPSTPANMTDMGTFLDEWRAAVNSECKNSNNNPCLILTMSVYYSPVMDTMTYPVQSIHKNLDWVHLRSYDYHLPSKDKLTGAHAALYDPLSTLNTDYGVKEWISKGLPANKLVLGLSYHGYAWTLQDSKVNSIGSPAKGLAITKDGSMSYRYIKGYIKSYGVKLEFNSTYVINYCTIGAFWITFDDVEAIKAKVSYAKNKDLLGYYIWQVPNDDMNWVLSRAASEEEEEAEQEEEGAQLKKKLLLVALLPAIAFSILLCTIVYFQKRKIIRLKVSRTKASSNRLQSPSLQVFSFAYMKAATENFPEAKKLGEGGFGPVYKGNLTDGQEIAVKRLAGNSKQGSEEFKNELALAAKLQHVNVLGLLGFCNEREEKLLIYEFMPNKSLDFHLYDPIRQQDLDWEKRVGIIDGITQGLLYLQDYSIYTVIHRDLKASNILLDNEMKPKISDFGIARMFRKDEHEAKTSRIIGTYGYVPPEYVKRGTYSRKYDVYSFGVLLLQIVSGKRNSSLYSEQKNLNLMEYAYQSWKDDNASEFLDPSLDDASSSCKIMRCLHVALLCVQEKWEDRPSMLEIYSMLKNETETLPTPKMPAFSTTKNEDAEKKFRSGENFCSVNTTTISEVLPR